MMEPDLEKKVEEHCITDIFPEYCDKHVKKTDTICHDCNASLCLDCKKLHNEHETQDIADFVRIFSKKKMEIKTKYDKCISDTKKLIEDLNSTSRYLEELTQKITERKRNIYIYLDQTLVWTMGNIKLYENTTKSHLIQQLDHLNAHAVELERILDLLKKPKTLKDAAALLKQDIDFQKETPVSLEHGIIPTMNFPDDNECKSVLKILFGTFNYSPSTVMNLPNARLHELIHLGSISSVYHVCVRRCGANLLVSDDLGNLLHIDKENKTQAMIQTPPSKHGYFTSSQDGDIIYYIDFSAGKVIKVNENKTRKVFFSEKKYWQLRCLTLSKNGANIIIGMASSKGECKISSHTYDGLKTWDIRLQRSGDIPVSKLINICENINGDICLSLLKSSVISVQRNGTIRFSYTGSNPKSNFFPGGICNDNNGRIIICNSTEKNSSIHLIDENGVFLGILLTKEQCMAIPLSVSIDENLMIVGWFKQNDLTCYNLI